MNYQYLIAVLEFITVIFVLFGLFILWKNKVHKSYLLFSLLAIIGPTLTGTFSSIPRYVLVAFPIFLLPNFYQSTISVFLLFIYSLFLLFVLCGLFTQGYWVA